MDDIGNSNANARCEWAFRHSVQWSTEVLFTPGRTDAVFCVATQRVRHNVLTQGLTTRQTLCQLSPTQRTALVKLPWRNALGVNRP